ncbi:MAG: methyltransferase domain-containing protein [Candidatus Methylomirabilales bacterium]
MRPELIQLLACPHCAGDLDLVASKRGMDDKAQEGELVCRCGRRYAIVRGIPRFVGSEAYAVSFGFQWNRFARTQLDSASKGSESLETFLAKTGFNLKELKGKRILDVGCGMGRFAEVCAQAHAEVVGFDLSVAVEAANTNLSSFPNTHIVQADIFRMPFPPESFDHIYSIGVLHHTPDCEKAFRQLPRLLKPGGRIAIWVYGHMGPWVKFTDLYRRLTVRMSPRLLFALCHLSIPMYYVYKIPFLGELLWILLPASRHPKSAWRILDTFDWYSPQYQSRHTYPDVYRWFRSEGLIDIKLLDVPVAISGVKPLQSLREE